LIIWFNLYYIKVYYVCIIIIIVIIIITIIENYIFEYRMIKKRRNNYLCIFFLNIIGIIITVYLFFAHIECSWNNKFKATAKSTISNCFRGVEENNFGIFENIKSLSHKNISILVHVHVRVCVRMCVCMSCIFIIIM
jgi:hypothetical protein